MKKLRAIIFLFALSGGFLFAQDSLVAYWNFDEVRGDTIFDHSANGNHGTNYGAILTEGIKGNALFFDGVDDYVRVPRDGKNAPKVFSELSKGSISIWFRADEIKTRQGISPIFFYGANEICDFFDAANQGMIIELGHDPIFLRSKALFFTMWTNGCTFPSFCYDSNKAITEGEWHNFVAVVGDDFNTGYFDGKLMADRWYNFANAQTSEFFSDALKHEKMWFGKGHWNRTTQHFNGAIDEIKIFNKPLSVEEVKDLYQQGKNSTSVREITLLDKFNIFPNPASDKISITLDEPLNTIEKVKIINLEGREVSEHIFTSGSEIDISHLQTGVYFVYPISKQNSFSPKKLLITR